MKKLYKKYFLIFAAACLFIFLLFFVLNKKILADNKYLEVFFLDIGQGDASILKLPGGNIILIDGGPNNLILKRLGEIFSFFKRDIKMIIVSHFHDDHIVGLIEVVKRYKVEHLFIGEGLEKNDLTKILLEEATKRKVEVHEIEGSVSLNVGINNDCKLYLLNPLFLGAKEDGNNSLIAKITCFDKGILFSGDNELEVESLLVRSNLGLAANIFKASHHGSKTSNSEDFLKIVNPRVVVISAGLNNRFNHPAIETLSTLFKLGIEVWRTDQSGTIHFIIR